MKTIVAQLGTSVGVGGTARVHRYDCTVSSQKSCPAGFTFPNRPIVVKTVKLPHFTRQVQTETIALYRMKSSPHVVKLYNVLYQKDAANLYMEYLPGGTLRGHIHHLAESEAECKEVVKTLLQAVSDIHDKGIIHRDIKPENIVFRNCSDVRSACLIDFGDAYIRDNTNNIINITPSMSLRGSPLYMSPEQLTYQVCEASDVWSIGVVMYNLLTNGKFPFTDSRNPSSPNLNQIWYSILFDQLPIADRLSAVSDDAIDLMQNMFIKNPDKRVSASDCLQHPWLKT